jgi:hypothetical protein
MAEQKSPGVSAGAVVAVAVGLMAIMAYAGWTLVQSRTEPDDARAQHLRNCVQVGPWTPTLGAAPQVTLQLQVGCAVALLEGHVAGLGDQGVPLWAGDLESIVDGGAGAPIALHKLKDGEVKAWRLEVLLKEGAREQPLAFRWPDTGAAPPFVFAWVAPTP